MTLPYHYQGTARIVATASRLHNQKSKNVFKFLGERMYNFEDE